MGLPSVGTDGFSKFLFLMVTIKTIMHAIPVLISIEHVVIYHWVFL